MAAGLLIRLLAMGLPEEGSQDRADCAIWCYVTAAITSAGSRTCP
jgi:hypothetical protein